MSFLSYKCDCDWLSDERFNWKVTGRLNYRKIKASHLVSTLKVYAALIFRPPCSGFRLLSNAGTVANVNPETVLSRKARPTSHRLLLLKRAPLSQPCFQA